VSTRVLIWLAGLIPGSASRSTAPFVMNVAGAITSLLSRPPARAGEWAASFAKKGGLTSGGLAGHFIVEILPFSHR
jgi:hypothetical protein